MATHKLLQGPSRSELAAQNIYISDGCTGTTGNFDYGTFRPRSFSTA